MRRFVVAEASMSPVLEPGDVVVARRDDHPPPGSIVVFPHPTRPGMWLVKRATAVSGGEAWVESDNHRATMADSRTFGWLPTDTMYRAVLRHRRRFSITRL